VSEHPWARPALIGALAVLLSVVVPKPADSGPCTAGTAACAEWVSLDPGPARTRVYRTHALGTRDEQIVRALVVIHGAGRNADSYFRTALAAAFLADALDDTLVVAPRFASNDGGGCRDTLAPDEVNWGCTGVSWRAGGVAASDERLTSYDVADEILARLARKATFPNLRAIVVAGHSAGGQYVSRYAMANRAHDTLGVPVAYVVSNPSSYAYLDPRRPVAGATEPRSYEDARNCTTYDQWPYGLQNRKGQSARLTEEQLRKQLAERPVTYLLGELDTLPLAGFDSSCPAMAQGPNRLARGQAFAGYVNGQYGARHQVVVVPLCGHNARCMFTTGPALPLLFLRP
jgi:pimeloyl-ACP methyl ester carboxylesterase